MATLVKALTHNITWRQSLRNSSAPTTALLVDLGIDHGRWHPFFVTHGSKTMRNEIDRVFGRSNRAQQCWNHNIYFRASVWWNRDQRCLGITFWCYAMIIG